MLGVLVLVVVMAVYAGLERDVKDRLLGFTPHILLRQQPDGLMDAPMENWQEAAEMAATLPRVVAATAFVADNVLIDFESGQRPVSFRAVDTADPAQVEGVERMLDMENHPGSSADFGIDDRVVISSIIADQFMIGVGDRIRLVSARNIEQVVQTFRAVENPPLREAFAAEWSEATATLAAGWSEQDGASTLPAETYRAVYSTLLELYSQNIREPERALVEQILLAMDESEKPEDAEIFIFAPEQRESVEQGIAALQTTDEDKMNADSLKSLRSVVLPREAEVIGVYLASQMAITPDLFVPLPLGQGLAGLDGAVQGIALRLDDPYAADQAALASLEPLGPGWSLLTWGQQYQAFFNLINQQRVMMYFALSFIVLVSAFSMMAVMFTVTIQKRREIGVMKALGAAPGQIVRVFLYQGMILGVLGAILGVGLGRVVIHFRGPLQSLFRAAGFDPFSTSFTGFGVLPAHNNLVEQAVIAFMAFVLCSLAALVPAFFAARSDAAKSLRNL
jgi:lipoprotein-releasing system permease protein